MSSLKQIKGETIRLISLQFLFTDAREWHLSKCTESLLPDSYIEKSCNRLIALEVMVR